MKGLKLIEVIVLVLFFIVLASLLSGCGTTHQTTRTAQGAALGAGIGALTGDGSIAAAGALIGGAVGSIVGTLESEKKGMSVSKQRAPLEWLLNGRKVKVVAVKGGWSYSDIVRATVEKALKNKGALIVVDPGSRHNSGYSYDYDKIKEGIDFVVEVFAQQSGEYVHASVNIIDAQTSVMKAIGTGRAWFSYGYGGYGYDYNHGYIMAARRAVADLR